MRQSDQQGYHEARAREELRRAEEATDPAVARLHRELAALHRRQMLAAVDGPKDPESDGASEE
jgi:hypothetical protein